MSEHYPSSTPENMETSPLNAEALQRAELVKFAPTQFYRDGRPKESGEYHVAVLCRTPGDTLTFSMTPKEQGGNPSAMDLGSGGVGTVWVVTETGSRFGIAGGYFYSYDRETVRPLDQSAGQMELSIGKEAVLPGVGRAHRVKSILVGDEISPVDMPHTWTDKDASQARLVNAVDPLIYVRTIADRTAMFGEQDGRREVEVFKSDFAELPSKASFV